MRFFQACVLVLFVLIPQTVHAEWLEASSNHFVVYGNTSESNLRKFSDQLERYDAAMGKITSTSNPPPSPSNRVTVYLVDNEEAVRKLIGGGKAARFVGGFYIPRAGGSLAVIPRVQSGGGNDGGMGWSMIVLLHEYAHHFLISNSAFPYPRWMGEGAAEFFASANFEKDGSVGLGRPAVHRANELALAADVTATDLLDPEHYEKRRGKSTAYDAYYGKSWLLYHYLTFSAERKGQLSAYSRALLSGKSMVEAGHAAFGDFAQLEKELDSYLRKPRMSYLKLAGTALDPGTVTIRVLREGEAAIMPVRIRSKVGVNKETAPGVLADARAVAAKYPEDPAVLAALAEAEYDAGNDAEAIVAADGAIGRDPGQVNAYLQKGYALFRIAGKGEGDAVAAWRAARAPFLALNAIENDHPLPLLYFYLSYRRQGREPTENAVMGLERASELSPFDLGLRMTVAMQELHDGRTEAARFFLVPVAYNPHGGPLAGAARKVLDRIASDPAWRGDGTVIDPATKDDEEGGEEGG
ncbi:MAG: hypothetical protein H6916_02050 [Novosphingobium sp.]|uniref:hypothetical protein n=1 Tax=Novosphingobium sp. TaxID=1874826 RepID=UPI001D8A0D71|nr:hypothetical protein [Novosphingobium sp.]MCB2057797.1 hypothetical protein [Novosphingobium sp.]MCP5385588.1 hypothetical protein [Novosphingobium sp.]